MARYIDAVNCVDIISEKLNIPLDDLVDVFAEVLTADVVEVKHGEWQRQSGGFFFLCSVCGKAAATKGNYCHNCGACMDGKSQKEG